MSNFLEMVLLEGLRLGMIPATERECTKAWKIHGEDFVIPVGMHVIIPTVRISLLRMINGIT